MCPWFKSQGPALSLTCFESCHSCRWPWTVDAPAALRNKRNPKGNRVVQIVQVVQAQSVTRISMVVVTNFFERIDHESRKDE